MQITCQRGPLTAAFQTVGGAVPARTPKDILKNVKLEVGAQGAILIGTDSECSLRCQIPDVECTARGEALLPTGRVLQILRELNDELVRIEATGDAIWIRGGLSEFRLSAEDPADFPPVADFEDEEYFILPTNEFRQAIRRTIFATDPESTRYALGGVLVELTPERATLAATDSRRLAVMHIGCRMKGEALTAGTQPIIPAKGMQVIEKGLADGDEELHLAIHANDAVLRCGRTVVSTQLVQGRFPDYRKVIPTSFNMTIDVPVGPFHSAVRQAQIVTNEESRGVDFTFSPGTLRLSSKATDVGQSKIELPIAFDGPEVTITFDPRYVSDFLRVLDPASQAQIRIIDHDSAAVLSAEDRYTYVIMPLSRD
jgi:DNA polymerase-3 subunit beta